MRIIPWMNTNEKKKIAILGSTGSIGTQALQVIEEHADLYEAYVLTANNRVELLIEQARRFMPEAVVIANEDKYEVLRDALADLPVKVYAGAEALCQIVQERPVDVVLTAMVGFAGLRPTISAIKAGKAIALANKETLVVAGELKIAECSVSTGMMSVWQMIIMRTSFRWIRNILLSSNVWQAR